MGLLIIVYLVAGIIVYSFVAVGGYAHSLEKRKRTTHRAKALLFPEVVLLWPYILFINLKYGDGSQQMTAPGEDEDLKSDHGRP